VKDLLDSTASIASVADNAQSIDILIFGGGRGGAALLDVFASHDWVHVHAIVDISADAPAFSHAREMGITCSTDAGSMLADFTGDMIVDVTGDPSMYKKLQAMGRLKQIEIISGKSAKLLFDLITHRISDRKIIQTQNTRMDILDRMLEITTLLEHRPPVADITNKAFSDIHTHLQATKGLAIMFSNEGKAEKIIGSIGMVKPTCNFDESLSLQHALRDISRHHRFKEFVQPIQLKCTKRTEAFNVIVPLWEEDRLAGILLFDMPETLFYEQNKILDITSVHLHMSIKTLNEYKKMKNIAALDPLTNIYNRRIFEKKIKSEVSRCLRSKDGYLSCAFIDLDGFKHVNDQYGHQAGDAVLKHVVACVQKCIREYDIFSRFGGDEFVLLLPSDHSDNVGQVYHVGERILEQIAASRVPDYPDIQVSVSIGIATQSAAVIVDATVLLKEADKALYQAKKDGKGRMKCLSFFGQASAPMKG